MSHDKGHNSTGKQYLNAARRDRPLRSENIDRLRENIMQDDRE
jgi:hypothetical protein